MKITLNLGWGKRAQTFVGSLTKRQQPKEVLKQGNTEYFLTDKTFYIDSESLKIRYTGKRWPVNDVNKNLYMKVNGVFIFLRNVNTELTILDNENVNSIKSTINNRLAQMDNPGFKAKMDQYFNNLIQAG